MDQGPVHVEEETLDLSVLCPRAQLSRHPLSAEGALPYTAKEMREHHRTELLGMVNCGVSTDKLLLRTTVAQQRWNLTHSRIAQARTDRSSQMSSHTSNDVTGCGTGLPRKQHSSVSWRYFERLSTPLISAGKRGAVVVAHMQCHGYASIFLCVAALGGTHPSTQKLVDTVARVVSDRPEIHSALARLHDPFIVSNPPQSISVE